MAELNPGDRVTVSATHQVKIDGLDAWIKAEVNVAVQDDETASEAFTRASGAVSSRIEGLIVEQATVIMNANKAQR